MPQEYKLSKQYANKRAFVTNATSDLGKSLCIELAHAHWTIGIEGRDSCQLQEIAALINSAGGKAITCVGDISNVSGYGKIAEKFLSEVGGIDVLINNTGINSKSVFGDFSVEMWQYLIDTNQMAVIYGCHFFMPYMIQNKSGYIINVACSAVSDSPEDMAPYTMARGAVISLSETINAKFNNSNIGITIALPCLFQLISAHGKIMTNALTETPDSEVAKLILEAAGLNVFQLVI
jgi:NADP-dependent 3-hydroxy acid dehydrogenase YdfG